MSSAKHLINSQPEETWAELNSRFIKHDVDYEEVLSSQLLKFVKNRAISVGTNIGYVLSSMITTANFLAGKNKNLIEIRNGYTINLNTFVIFVGQPSTGKSPALKLAVYNPLQSIDEDLSVMSTATTSGLTKFLCNNNCAYIVNAEIQEYLYKILRKNDENYTGDVEILSKVFSGEKITMQFSTENKRNIPESCAFCILGKNL